MLTHQIFDPNRIICPLESELLLRIAQKKVHVTYMYVTYSFVPKDFYMSLVFIYMSLVFVMPFHNFRTTFDVMEMRAKI